VIETRQYNEMNSSCASAPPSGKPENIKAARKTRRWETNASDPLGAPQAAKGRETNASCPRETAKSMGTRVTKVSGKETAAARRDREPLTSEAGGRGRRTAVAEHQAAGELSSPS
jgi:hypothetical protein